MIPAAIRARAGLVAGTELEIVVDDLSVRILRAVSGPRLVREGKRLRARPTVKTKDRPKVDVAELIEEERNRWPW